MTALVQAGGARINDGGYSTEIDQPLLHDPALGATADGGLFKTSPTGYPSTLILTGNNTYTGPTTINAGTLQLGNNTASGSLGTGAVSINSGTTLVLMRTDTFIMPNSISGAGTLHQTGYGSTVLLTAPNLSFTGPVIVDGGCGFGGNTTVNTLSLADGSILAPSDGTNLGTITVATTNGLSNGGTVTIAPGLLGATAYTNGLHVLVSYTGTTISSGYTLSLPSRVVGTLQYNPGAIDLNVTAVKYPRWKGVTGSAGSWDIASTADWTEYSTGNATTYQESPQADLVYFDDTATGLTTVNLTTTVQPTQVNVNNNTKTYTFESTNGLGVISGSTALIKNGTGTLILSNTGNTYTGGTTINAGTLSFDTGTLPSHGHYQYGRRHAAMAWLEYR